MKHEGLTFLTVCTVLKYLLMLNIVYTGKTNYETPKLPRADIKSHRLAHLCHARAT